MKLNVKSILTVLLLLAVTVFAAACGEQTPYQTNDAEGYNVSIKFDANGGSFTTTNTPVIVDSYNISQLKTNGDGMVDIAVLDPADTTRKASFEAKRTGYFLAGWYAERTENGTDADGNTLYTYSEQWDFSGVLSVDPSKTYSSETPVLTLYAVWVPEFQIEYYCLDTGELLQTVSVDPSKGSQITLPVWNEETGALDMNSVPSRPGYTYTGLYYDAAGTQAVEEATLTHPGSVDPATGTAQNATMQLYVDWTEGEWYKIYTAEQFVENASVSGSYEICADLDFSEEIWPSSLMYGTYTGTIRGNGHTFSNISIAQTNNSKTNAGLFGQLSETAALVDLNLENVTVTIQSGTRVAGTCYGLLAGVISDGAEISGLQIANGQLLIDSGAYFGTEDYTIGLLCGMGQAPVDASGITCAATGDSPEKLLITVTDGIVTVETAA